MNIQSEDQINLQGTDEEKSQQEKSQTAKGQVKQKAAGLVLSFILGMLGVQEDVQKGRSQVGFFCLLVCFVCLVFLLVGWFYCYYLSLVVFLEGFGLFGVFFWFGNQSSLYNNNSCIWG